jgi:hypothetical protein
MEEEIKAATNAFQAKTDPFWVRYKAKLQALEQQYLSIVNPAWHQYATKRLAPFSYYKRIKEREGAIRAKAEANLRQLRDAEIEPLVKQYFEEIDRIRAKYA